MAVMKVSTWNNCYDNQWAGLIVPDAFSHPAKFSPGLIQKIYAHGIERGYFKPGGFEPIDSSLKKILLDEINSGDYYMVGLKFAGGEKTCNIQEESEGASVGEKEQNLNQGKNHPTNNPLEPSRLDNSETTRREPGLKSQSQTHGSHELDMSGCNMEEQSQKDLFSTTPAKIQQRTTLGISCLSIDPDIQGCTKKKLKRPEIKDSFQKKRLFVRDVLENLKENTNGMTPCAIAVESLRDAKLLLITKRGYVLSELPKLNQKVYRQPDIISDPFGGIAGGGIFAAYAKLQWIGLELESKFVDLAQQNIELHRPAWEAHGYPLPMILQGDSRRFAEIVGQCEAICTSPPFVDSIGLDGGAAKRPKEYGHIGSFGKNYGQAPGQIGNLKAGDLQAVVTSPPYADSVNAKGHGIDWKKADPETTGNRKRGPGCKHEETFRSQLSYSDNPANIGKLSAVVTSPPFEDKISHQDANFTHRLDGTRIAGAGLSYGDSPGQIGKLRSKGLDGVVTSPPFEDCEPTRDDNFRYNGKKLGSTGSHYGKSTGQIGNEKSETYWQAMTHVYSECHKALKPGGYLIIVVKSYVKNKRRVHLPMQTLKLLIHLGFEPVERIRAMLVKENVNVGLFGEDIVNRKERKSFFRRLAEQKGSPRIDWEEVIVTRKPELF